MHTTNYIDAFIEVADDCPNMAGTIPPEKAPRTVASMQYSMISGNPYGFTSDDVLFGAYAEKRGIEPGRMDAERAQFFSKGQPCLRASPLGKTYGWGIHSDGMGRVALYSRDSEEYARLEADVSVKHLKAMKGSR